MSSTFSLLEKAERAIQNRRRLQKVLDDFEKLGLLIRNGNGDYEPDLKRLEELGLIEWLPDGSYRTREA